MSHDNNSTIQQFNNSTKKADAKAPTYLLARKTNALFKFISFQLVP